VLVACVLASLLASSSLASPPYAGRDVAFVTLFGHGTVRSVPRGIRCPGSCRAVFARGTHLQLYATPTKGWRFVGFDSKWCGGIQQSCAFDLVSPHDCVGGACPLGAFGVRVTFVRAGSPA